MSTFDGLGNALKLLRVEQGKSQAELSEAAGVGKSLLSRYESGITMPKLETLKKLLEALGVGLPELTEALERVQKHSGSSRAGMRQELERAAARSRLAAANGAPKAFLLLDISDALSRGNVEDLTRSLLGFQSLFQEGGGDFPRVVVREAEDLDSDRHDA